MSDERREVAERLLVVAARPDVDGEVYVNDALAALGVAVGCHDGYVAAESVVDLADLIDPTCHIVLKPSDSDFNDEPHYLCSRCGKAGIDVYERDDYTLAGIVDHSRYCSNCGARVVSVND